MTTDHVKKQEERLNAFLNSLFTLDSATMVFFLWIIKGDVLGTGTLPFQLASFPFKPNVLTLATCGICILIQRTLNLFFHDRPKFQNVSRLAAVVLLIASVIAIANGGWRLIENPDFLSGGKK